MSVLQNEGSLLQYEFVIRCFVFKSYELPLISYYDILDLVLLLWERI